MDKTKEHLFDEWLVLQAQAGDAKALRELLTRWHKKAYAYAMAELKDHEAASEASQEALISISKGLRRLRDPITFPKWAYQIIIRRCRDWQRKEMRWKKHHVSIEHDVPMAQRGGDASADDRDHEVELLRQGLNRLEKDLSQLLRLYYLEGFSIADLSAMLKIPKGTVKSRLYYARKRLQDILEV